MTLNKVIIAGLAESLGFDLNLRMSFLNSELWL